jgi:hypothetical protein
VLVVDYDLLKSTENHFLTGESFAYLSRCYSSCGAIIVVNQFGGDVFDLTLQGHAESFADVNVGSKQLLCEGLWRDKWSGFRAWHWPVVPQLVIALEGRVKHITKNLDMPIIEALELSAVVASLSGPAAQFIQGNIKKEVDKITFRDFVTRNGNNGLRYKDSAIDDDHVGRIAASRIGKWLERLVLTGQDVLVDAPHLVSRFPSLLTGPISKADTWNRVVQLEHGKQTGLRASIIDRFRFKRTEWLSRPAWFWSQVAQCRDIAEVSKPFSSRSKLPDLVFCEDISRFAPRAHAREFLGDLPSPFVKRYVADPKQKKYKSLQDFTYAPEIRFALG